MSDQPCTTCEKPTTAKELDDRGDCRPCRLARIQRTYDTWLAESTERIARAGPRLLAALRGLMVDYPRDDFTPNECECVEFYRSITSDGPECRHTRAWAALDEAEGRS